LERDLARRTREATRGSAGFIDAPHFEVGRCNLVVGA
jgi:hypothetical protein